jgi:branched-chain amino acid transport system substrate-binding protein
MQGDNKKSSDTNRRDYLKLVGVLGTGAFAGCIQGPGSGDSESNGSGGSSGSGGSGPIKIGAPSAFTGGYDYLQKGVTKVGKLTIDQINAAGGPLDREFGWIQRDTSLDPQKARQVMTRLINVENVQVINGLFSSEIPPNWDYIQQQEVPIVTHWPGSRFLDNRGGDNHTPDDLSDDEWIWRTMISDSVHTAGAVINAKQRGVSTVGIINAATEGDRSVADGFTDAMAVMDGIKTVKQLEVGTGKSSYQSELNRLFQTDFDAMALAASLKTATTVLRDWNAAGYESSIMLADGLKHPDLISTVGGILPHNTWLGVGGASGPARDGLVAAFDKKYGTKNMGKHNHPWAIATFDALNVIALAIHRGGSYDTETIEKNIGHIARSKTGKDVTSFEQGKAVLDDGNDINFNGAMSNCNFDRDGDVTSDVSIFRPTADGFERLEPIQSEAIKDVISDPDYSSGK